MLFTNGNVFPRGVDLSQILGGPSPTIQSPLPSPFLSPLALPRSVALPFLPPLPLVPPRLILWPFPIPGVRVHSPRKLCEIADVRSCILVHFGIEIRQSN